ncbi:MAG: hypothetical protein ACPGRE_04875 [Flavobacteriaceae bacterium]
MNEISPYTSLDAALNELDNGGRFYNVFTEAKDGEISTAELSKVAGIFSNKQKSILFLALSISNLTEGEQKNLISKLDDTLREAYLKFQPQNLLPSQAGNEGILASNAILTGVPRFIDSKSEFSGFIMVPIMVGNITTFSMIPIVQNYDIYELSDPHSSETFIIAQVKGKTRLPEQNMTIGGVFKELRTNKEEKEASKKFLEVAYHILVE